MNIDQGRQRKQIRGSWGKQVPTEVYQICQQVRVVIVDARLRYIASIIAFRRRPK